MNITKAKLLDELIGEAKDRSASLQQQLSFQEQYIRDLENKKKALNNGDNSQLSEELNICPDVVSLNLPDAIKIILHYFDKPMRARDIAEKLKDKGYKSTSKSGLLPSVNSALKRRDDLFKKTKRGIYKLKTTD